jgi:type IV secretory pathway TrbF-like protein
MPVARQRGALSPSVPRRGIAPPTDADRLRKNPLGVYVHALNWSKELG